MDGQVSSAYDLTLFARAGLRNADFRSYCSTRTAHFPGGLDKLTGQRTSFDIANTDRLLGKYQGLIGVKNGYTTNAGATFTGAAQRSGRTLLVTVMHPDTQTRVYDEASALLDWGFAAADKVQPVGQLVEDTAAARPAGITGRGSTASAAPAATAGQARPQAVRGNDPGLAPAAWTAIALGAVLALWAAGRTAARRHAAVADDPAALPDPGATALGGQRHRGLARRARALVRHALDFRP